MKNILNVNGEETFIGKNKIVLEHLSNKIVGSELIRRELFRLIVDTDSEIVLDIVKDLYLDKELMCIKDIEGYSNIRNNKWLRKFSKGINTLDFYLICAVDKIPEINRSKLNGLGIQFRKRSFFPVKIMTVSRDNLSNTQDMIYEERDVLFKDLINGTY